MSTPIPKNRARFRWAEMVDVTAAESIIAADSTGAGGPETVGVTTDSRAVEAGNLFVALRGSKFDGHRFLESAIRGGASAVLVDREGRGSVPDGVPALVVKDTLVALGQLANLHRRRWGKTVVGITGSAGKTGTKEMTAAALAADGTSVHRTHGNLNNRIGVPMTLFELHEGIEIAVVEMGTSLPGEIEILARISEPNIGVVTLVAASHTQGLGTLRQVAEEKAAMLRCLDSGGVAVANGDVTSLKPWIESCTAGKVITYGTGPGVTNRLADARIVSSGECECTIILNNGTSQAKTVTTRLSVLGAGAAMNSTAAISIALVLGKPIDLVLSALAKVGATKGRMQVRVCGGMTVLDDTYNANPSSTDLALDTAASLAKRQKVRSVAVLGDMLELGESSREHHLFVAERARHAGIDVFVGCGGEMKVAADYLRNAGASQVEWVSDSIQAAELAKTLVKAGDVVLVKGSRSMAMEKVVQELCGDDSETDEERVP